VNISPFLKVRTSPEETKVDETDEVRDLEEDEEVEEPGDAREGVRVYVWLENYTPFLRM